MLWGEPQAKVPRRPASATYPLVTVRASGWGALSRPWGRLLRNYTKFGIRSCFLEEAFTARASPSHPPASHGVIQGFDFAFMKLGAFCSPPARRSILHPPADLQGSRGGCSGVPLVGKGESCRPCSVIEEICSLEMALQLLPMPPPLPSGQISFWSSGESCENIYIKGRQAGQCCRIAGVMRV